MCSRAASSVCLQAEQLRLQRLQQRPLPEPGAPGHQSSRDPGNANLLLRRTRSVGPVPQAPRATRFSQDAPVAPHSSVTGRPSAPSEGGKVHSGDGGSSTGGASKYEAGGQHRRRASTGGGPASTRQAGAQRGSAQPTTAPSTANAERASIGLGGAGHDTIIDSSQRAQGDSAHRTSVRPSSVAAAELSGPSSAAPKQPADCANDASTQAAAHADRHRERDGSAPAGGHHETADVLHPSATQRLSAAAADAAEAAKLAAIDDSDAQRAQADIEAAAEAAYHETLGRALPGTPGWWGDLPRAEAPPPLQLVRRPHVPA